jgi:hypothetical protein
MGQGLPDFLWIRPRVLDEARLLRLGLLVWHITAKVSRSRPARALSPVALSLW